MVSSISSITLIFNENYFKINETVKNKGNGQYPMSPYFNQYKITITDPSGNIVHTEEIDFDYLEKIDNSVYDDCHIYKTIDGLIPNTEYNVLVNSGRKNDGYITV